MVRDWRWPFVVTLQVNDELEPYTVYMRDLLLILKDIGSAAGRQ